LRYLGGKSRIADVIVSYIQPYVNKSKGYIEPFSGACNIGMKINHPVRVMCDANKSLITMWKSLLDGFHQKF
jgi:site-specific DNA-adenine methylase